MRSLLLFLLLLMGTGLGAQTRKPDFYPPRHLSIVKDNAACLYGLMDSLGNWRVPASYSYISAGLSGYFYTRTGDYCGVLDPDGNTVLSCVYGSVQGIVTGATGRVSRDKISSPEELRTKRLVALNPDFYPGEICFLTGRGDYYALADSKGKMLTGFQWFNIDVGKENIIVVDTLGWCGMRDRHFKDLVPCRFRDISALTDSCYYAMNADGLYGLLDYTGKMIIPCLFSGIDLGIERNTFVLYKGEMPGLYSSVIRLPADTVIPFTRGNISNGSDADYSRRDVYELHLNPASSKYQEYDSVRIYAVNGKVLQQEDIAISGTSVSYQLRRKYWPARYHGRYGLLSDYSVWKVNPEYDSLVDIQRSGIYAGKQHGKWAIINPDRNMATTCLFDAVPVMEPGEGSTHRSVFIVRKNGLYYLHDGNCFLTDKGFRSMTHVDMLYDEQPNIWKSVFRAVSKDETSWLDADGKEWLRCATRQLIYPEKSYGINRYDFFWLLDKGKYYQLKLTDSGFQRSLLNLYAEIRGWGFLAGENEKYWFCRITKTGKEQTYDVKPVKRVSGFAYPVFYDGEKLFIVKDKTALLTDPDSCRAFNIFGGPFDSRNGYFIKSDFVHLQTHSGKHILVSAQRPQMLTDENLYDVCVAPDSKTRFWIKPAAVKENCPLRDSLHCLLPDYDFDGTQDTIHIDRRDCLCGWALSDTSGKALTPAGFGIPLQRSIENEQVFEAWGLSGMGLYSLAEKKFLIAPEYREVRKISRNLFVLISSTNLFGACDSSGRILLKPEYDKASIVYNFDHVRQIDKYLSSKIARVAADTAVAACSFFKGKRLVIVTSSGTVIQDPEKARMFRIRALVTHENDYWQNTSLWRGISIDIRGSVSPGDTTLREVATEVWKFIDQHRTEADIVPFVGFRIMEWNSHKYDYEPVLSPYETKIALRIYDSLSYVLSYERNWMPEEYWCYQRTSSGFRRVTTGDLFGNDSLVNIQNLLMEVLKKRTDLLLDCRNSDDIYGSSTHTFFVDKTGVTFYLKDAHHSSLVALTIPWERVRKYARPGSLAFSYH